MPQEVSVAKVFDISLVVIVDDTFCPRLDGADQATSAFVAALVMDDIETLAKEVARAKLPQEKVRGEVADRTAHVVRQLVEVGLIRVSGDPLCWRADFPRIRRRLTEAR